MYIINETWNLSHADRYNVSLVNKAPVWIRIDWNKYFCNQESLAQFAFRKCMKLDSGQAKELAYSKVYRVSLEHTPFTLSVFGDFILGAGEGRGL